MNWIRNALKTEKTIWIKEFDYHHFWFPLFFPEKEWIMRYVCVTESLYFRASFVPDTPLLYSSINSMFLFSFLLSTGDIPYFFRRWCTAWREIPKSSPIDSSVLCFFWSFWSWLLLILVLINAYRIPNKFILQGLYPEFISNQVALLHLPFTDSFVWYNNQYYNEYNNF